MVRLLCLFCLFVGLEEISYGQRLFGFATPPDLMVVNTQEVVSRGWWKLVEAA